MARLVTRSELARIAGVTPAAITKACKGALAEAGIGKRIDLDHPAVSSYLQRRGAKPTPGRPARRKRAQEEPAARPRRRRREGAATAETTPAPPAGDRSALAGVREASAEEIEAYAHLSLDALVDLFGTAVAFKDWLDARKKISDIREKDLRNAETEGRLISRELVKTHVFGALESGNRRLLGDSPKTIARRLYALAKSGAPVEEAEAVVREIISSQLKPVGAAAARVLRNA